MTCEFQKYGNFMRKQIAYEVFITPVHPKRSIPCVILHYLHAIYQTPTHPHKPSILMLRTVQDT